MDNHAYYDNKTDIEQEARKLAENKGL